MFRGVLTVAQWAKVMVLSLWWLGFDLWPQELPCAVGAAKKKKKSFGHNCVQDSGRYYLE